MTRVRLSLTFAVVFAALLVAVPAAAQVPALGGGSGSPGLRVFSSGGGGLTCSGCSSGDVVRYNGTALVPTNITSDGTDSTIASGALKFAGGQTDARLKNTSGTYGWYWASALFTMTDGAGAGTKLLSFDGANGHIQFQRDAQLKFGAGQDSTSTMDTGLARPEAGALRPSDASTGGGYFYFNERTAPTGTANVGKMYAKDNGSGKTQLCAIFGSGAEQCFATEP